MGCCLWFSKESKIYDEQSLMTIINSAEFPQMRLQFFIDAPSRIQRQCLIIFTNTAFNTAECAFFKAVGSSDQNKLQKQLQKHSEATQIKIGDFLLVENPLKMFKVKYLLLVIVPVWKKADVNEEIGMAFKKAFDQFIRLKMKTLVICEPCGYLGIPNNVAAKVIMKGIHDTKSSLNQITFFFSSKQNQTYYHQVAAKYQTMQQISQVHSDY